MLSPVAYADLIPAAHHRPARSDRLDIRSCKNGCVEASDTFAGERAGGTASRGHLAAPPPSVPPSPRFPCGEKSPAQEKSSFSAELRPTVGHDSIVARGGGQRKRRTKPGIAQNDLSNRDGKGAHRPVEAKQGCCWIWSVVLYSMTICESRCGCLCACCSGAHGYKKGS